MRQFSSLMMILTLGVALSAPLSARQPGEQPRTGEARDMSTRTMDVEDDSRFDAGWLGLIGLAGMLGMRRKESRAAHTVRTDHTNPSTAR